MVLEPMNPYERRILHATLQDNPYVTTHSEGDEPNRRVVITPKRCRRSEEISKPNCGVECIGAVFHWKSAQREGKKSLWILLHPSPRLWARAASL